MKGDENTKEEENELVGPETQPPETLLTQPELVEPV